MIRQSNKNILDWTKDIVFCAWPAVSFALSMVAIKFFMAMNRMVIRAPFLSSEQPESWIVGTWLLEGSQEKRNHRATLYDYLK